MKFSIIVPSFNQGQFLKDCIDSILSQETDEAVEIIVMDGGSTDNSIDILRSYGNQINWTSEPDNGQAHAINKGLEKSTGQVIAYINSDDTYEPGAFKAVEETLLKNPQTSALYGLANHIDKKGKSIEAYPVEEWDYKLLEKTCFLCQPSVFWRRSVIDEFGTFREDLHYCLDFEYWLRVGKQRPFYFLKTHLANSRLHGETKTLSQRVESHIETAKMVWEVTQNKSATTHWLLCAAQHWLRINNPQHAGDHLYNIEKAAQLSIETKVPFDNAYFTSAYRSLQQALSKQH